MRPSRTIAIGSTLALTGGLLMGTAASPASAASQGFGAGSHAWVVPAGVTSITLEVLGAGGGASKFGTPANSPAGGAGAKVTVKNLRVTPGETIKFGVGTGGSSAIPNAGGGGGAASIAYRGNPDSPGLLVVAGGGGGGGSMASKTVGQGANGAANGTATGGSTAGNISGDGGCGGSTGGSNGTGGIIPDPASCTPGADLGYGFAGLFGNGGKGGMGTNGGTLPETGTGVGGEGGEDGSYYGGGGGGGYGGGAGGVARGNPVNTGVGGAAGGSGVFNSAKNATVSYAPGSNGGQNSNAGGEGSVLIKWGNEAPNKPRNVKVSGNSSAKTHTITWRAPKAGGAPVTGYLVTIRVKRTKKLVYSKSVKKKTLKVRVSKRTLLKNTLRSRGEISGNIRYVVTVRARSASGIGPGTTSQFSIRA